MAAPFHFSITFCGEDNCRKSILVYVRRFFSLIWLVLLMVLFIRSLKVVYILSMFLHCMGFFFSWGEWSSMMENQFDDGKTTAWMSFRKFPRLLITIHCWWWRRYCLLLLYPWTSNNRNSSTSSSLWMSVSFNAVGFFPTDSIHGQIHKRPLIFKCRSVYFIRANSSNIVDILRLIWNAINKFHNIKKQHFFSIYFVHFV